MDLQVFRGGEKPRRLPARLGAYDDVFANAEDWNTIAPQYQDAQYQESGTQGDSPRSGTEDKGGRAASGDGSKMRPNDLQVLERRVQRLEREVSDLRQQLSQGATTISPNNASTGANGATRERQNNGEKANSGSDRP